MAWISMQIDVKPLSRKVLDEKKAGNEKDGKVVKEGRKEKLLPSYKVTILGTSLRAISEWC